MDTQVIEMKCPSCGAPIKNDYKKEKIEYNFTNLGKREFEFSLLECQNCGEEIREDNFNENLAKFLKELDIENSLKGIEEIKTYGYSYTYLERALRIPYRTFSRWKSKKDLSAVAMSYINIISNFPWLVDVSDYNFDPKVKLKNLLIAGFLEFEKNQSLISDDIEYEVLLSKLESILKFKNTFASNEFEATISINDLGRETKNIESTVTLGLQTV
ncbi:hypothetical protein [Leptospira ilyithenensis]|uniref:YgiT-type zinc finger protein n=1 Tax=Leptospira ilyithenensis TaxID=2484901 RepID=A0A4R9LQQ2_9LEPT|nr:hypothetical protein [Leptospira ilyithenensis]TGN10567.1 hypothetical protein EHS11_09790 [Leptospira ilyithenensis]